MRAGYGQIGDSGAMPRIESAREYCPPWTRVEDNRLRSLQTRAKDPEDELSPADAAELADLDRRFTRFVSQGLKNMEKVSTTRLMNQQKLLQLGIVVRRLAWDLLRKTLSKPNGAVVAPFTDLLQLLVAASGAGGDTLSELKARCGALRLGGLDEVVRAACSLREDLEEMRDGALQNHLSVWIREGLKPTPAFEAAAAGIPCQVRELGTSQELTDWVAETAGQPIDTLDHLVRSSRLPSTSCLLLGTLTLHYAWKVPFPHELTTDQPFQATRCSMMHTRGAFNYISLPNKLSAVQLPLNNPDIEAVVILPETQEDEKGDSMTNLVEALAAGTWETMVKEMRVFEGDLWMPSFSVAVSDSLSTSLGCAGCPSAFNAAEADFSALASPSAGLCLSDCISNVVVAVGECGINTDQPTLGSSPAFPGAKRFHMRCDRPFLFSVVHRPSGAPLLTTLVSAATLRPPSHSPPTPSPKISPPTRPSPPAAPSPSVTVHPVFCSDTTDFDETAGGTNTPPPPAAKPRRKGRGETGGGGVNKEEAVSAFSFISNTPPPAVDPASPDPSSSSTAASPSAAVPPPAASELDKFFAADTPQENLGLPLPDGPSVAPPTTTNPNPAAQTVLNMFDESGPPGSAVVANLQQQAALQAQLNALQQQMVLLGSSHPTHSVEDAHFGDLWNVARNG